MKKGLSPLLGLNELTQSKQARAPKADISNAAHLMGDVGDVFQGDPQGAYGDVDDDDETGDVSTAAMDTFSTLIGDTKLRRNAKTAGLAVAGAGVTAGLAALIAKKARQKKALAATMRANAANNTIANQVLARRMMGKIPKTAAMPFYQVTGATLNSYPLAPTEIFAADTLKYNFDRQSTDTPFEVEIVNGVFAGVTWTLTATGTVAPRYYTAVFITIGISVLTANPGTIFQVTGTMPTINGSLVISTNPFSFTIRNGYYAKIVIFPWQLVTNKPLLALGSYSNATPIIFNLTGLPSNASVSMIVPGSQHPWTIGMRNRLI